MPEVVALAGGVGGAKLSAGLQTVLPRGELSVVVNTADDFTLWGLHISPDIDTVMYTLAGIANPLTGWGLQDESWEALGMIARYGRDPWFRIGDRDLATHVLRTQMLHEGRTLTEVTLDLASALGIPSSILPMTDSPVATLVDTDSGVLDFQDYFVRRRHGDTVHGVTFSGAEHAQPTIEVAGALGAARYVIFCPSNPIVSIGPILAIPGMSGLLERSNSVKVAVSPIIGGEAVKGPAAEMLRSLGHKVSPVGVAELYKGSLDGMVIDRLDAKLADEIMETGIAVRVEDTIMTSDESRAELARNVLGFCAELASRGTK